MAAGLALLLNCQASRAEDAPAAGDHKLLRLGGSWVKWGSPVIGTRARVTYALATRRMDFPNARNCRSIVPVEALLQESGISPQDFRRELRAAFDAWSRAADVTFVPVDDPARADIVIGAQRRPRGRAFTDVSYGALIQDKTRRIRRSLVCLNPAIRWKVGFDGNVDIYDLRYTLIHEIGHAIGLDHPGPSGQIMSFKYHEDFRGLQPGDIHGASLLYGRRNRTAAAPAQPAGGPQERQPRDDAQPGAAPRLSLGDTPAR